MRRGPRCGGGGGGGGSGSGRGCASSRGPGGRGVQLLLSQQLVELLARRSWFFVIGRAAGVAGDQRARCGLSTPYRSATVLLVAGGRHVLRARRVAELANTLRERRRGGRMLERGRRQRKRAVLVVLLLEEHCCVCVCPHAAQSRLASCPGCMWPARTYNNATNSGE
jgi:hypothetical protein